MGRRFLSSCLLASLVAACGEDPGDGRVVGALTVPDCNGRALERVCPAEVAPESCEAFDLGVDFFTLEVADQRAVIRLQEGGQFFAKTNGLLLEIRDVRQLRGNLGAPLPVAPNANIRGALGLFERCPETTQNFELQGEVVFERFGVAKGDRVAGRLVRLEVRDGRGEGSSRLLGVLHGDFDFTIRRGPPHEAFPGR